MDSHCNVTNEKSIDFEDGICDQDLEARLYAEIYYSNEAYSQDCETSAQRNKKTEGIVHCVAGSSLIDESESTVDNANVNTALPNVENHASDPTLLKDYAQGCAFSSVPNSDFRKTHWSKDQLSSKSGEGIINNFEHNNERRNFPKKQRLLARKGLWDVPKSVEERTCLAQERVKVLSNIAANTVDKHSAKVSETVSQTNILPIRRTADNELNDRVNHNDDRIVKKHAASKKKQKNARTKNKERIKIKAFGGTKKLRRNDNFVKRTSAIVETSKYAIVSKEKKLKMKKAYTDYTMIISSDSDDSILEVPVPPKAQPPVIQLPDSDEDCDKTSNSRENTGRRSNREFASGRNSETNSNESSDEETPAISDFTEIQDDSIIDATIADKTNGDMIHSSDELLLNCTEVQRGASSLEKIRKEHETTTTNEARSDDSMTESEANNWSNIAAGRVETADNQNICLIDESVDKSYNSLWNQYRDPISSEQSGINVPTGEEICILENEANSSVASQREGQNERTKRKRRKDSSSKPSKKMNLTELPKKKSKEKADESSTEKSLTEYFFKPMSKELQAFYNNPWSGEYPDVYELQSKMPKNPSCWAILDADLGTPLKRHDKAGSRCRTNSFFGKKCSEKILGPCCCMCGTKGHIETRCPQTMCLTCGHKYATFRPTCGYCSKLYCKMCNGTGHTHKNCPDLWRRYHNTTTEILPIPSDPRNIMKPSQNLSCCNCAKRGHDSTMCQQLRWSQHFPTPMYVSSYTEGPFYVPSSHNRVQDTNSDGHIDTVQTPHDENASPIDITKSMSGDNLIFQCGDFNFSKAGISHQILKRLDTEENIHLNGLLAGDLKPEFLNAWKNDFSFNVLITHNSDKLILLIQTNCEKLLKGIEKLLIQWLRRTDDEKRYMVYDKLPYGKLDEINIELGNKLLLLKNAPEPAKILKKITQSVKQLEIINAKASDPENLNKTVKNVQKWKEQIESTMSNVLKKRHQLITSLYKQSSVKDDNTIVRSFLNIARKIKWSTKPMTIQNYLEVIYAYNELFVFHEIPALTETFEKVTSSVSQLLKVVTLPPQQLTCDSIISGDTNLPEKIIENTNVLNHKCPSEGGDQQLENEPIPDDNSQHVSEEAQPSTVLVNAVTEYSPMPENFTIAEQPDLIASSSENVTDFSCDIELNVPTQFVIPNELSSPSNHPTLLLNHYGRMQQNNRNNQNKIEEMLANLPKKKRNRLMQTAHKTIKLANLSNKPVLQQMAKALKSKLADNSVRRCDIRSLQSAFASSGLNKAVLKKRYFEPRKYDPENRCGVYKRFIQSL